MDPDVASKGLEVMPLGQVERLILSIRGHRVILDADLARLYGVPTKRLNEQVKRNPKRFPEEFMFQLTDDETEALRSQIAASNKGRGGRRYRPYAFTEHGVIMAANVLNSHLAVEASVIVVQAFVRLRQILATHHELAKKMADLEQRIGIHDEAIRKILGAIRQLIEPPEGPPRERIGFHPRGGAGSPA